MKSNGEMLGRFIRGDGAQKDRPFMTVGDLARFREMREAGTFSILNCALCAVCKAQIPKSFALCSRECWKKGKLDGERANEAATTTDEEREPGGVGPGEEGHG